MKPIDGRHTAAAWPVRPAHPERVCWGCDKRCRADDLACGDEKERAPHPIELFGETWTVLREAAAS